jgi:hypothetical protein
MVVYLSKPMIMRINHIWGYQGWEDSEWWTCARAKENMTTRHRWRPRCRIAHGWKKSESFASQQRDTLPCTLFFFHLIHPSHIFLSTPLLSFYSSSSFILSYTYIYIFFTFLFFLSFPYSYFSLYFPPLHIFFSLFKALNSSLSCMYTIWFLNKNHARDETKLWK